MAARGGRKRDSEFYGLMKRKKMEGGDDDDGDDDSGFCWNLMSFFLRGDDDGNGEGDGDGENDGEVGGGLQRRREVIFWS